MDKVKLKFFASWREIVGQSELEWPLKAGQNTEELLQGLISEYPRLAPLAGAGLLMVNRQYAKRTDPLNDGDEIAFIPPVGGG